MEKLYYTAKEVAEMLDVSVSHAYLSLIHIQMCIRDSTQNAFSAEDAQALAGNRRRTSFEKAVSGMSSVELDAQLADVYAREFGMGKNDIAEDQRRK